MKSKLEIYALAVCFFCIGAMIIAGSIAANSLLHVAAPATMLSAPEYMGYQSNSAYLTMLSDENKKKLPDAEVTKLREAQYASAINQQ